MTAPGPEKLAQYAAAALMVTTISIAGIIQFSVIQTMGWFLGVIGIIALAGEITSPLFWQLNKFATSLVLVICLSTSATLELAFYRQELSKLVETREAAILKRDHLQKEIQELRDRLWVGRERLPEMIQADINRKLSRQIKLRRKTTTIALATKDCSPKSRLTLQLCDEILNLRTQLAASLGIDKMEKKLVQKQKEFDTLEAVGDSNPLTRTIVELIRMHWEVSDASVETFIRIFYVVFIHTMLMSSSCFYFKSRSFDNLKTTNQSSVEILPRPEAKSPDLTLSLLNLPSGRDVAEHFLKTRLKVSKSNYIDLNTTYGLYADECETVACNPVAANTFSRMLADRGLHTSKTRGTPTGGIRYWGITIADN